MPKAYGVAIALFIMAIALESQGESTWEYSVQVSAIVQSNPAQIVLTWPQDTVIRPASYTVFRKAPGASRWGTGVPLPGTSTSYTDHNVAVGTGYEYQVIKNTSRYIGYGYIYAGINLPLVEDRGKLLLLVDNTYAEQLASELAQLQLDLAGDGWTVIRNDVSRSASVLSIKNLIKAHYRADPSNVKSVFLFGHIPVAYSGDIVPDGHSPDHQGAWPCDGFYGDMDGIWTDSFVNDISAADARTRNVPGDGKFDPSTFPAPLKLMVGRVDLANLPGRLSWGGPATFPGELELLRNYLNKNHRFRMKQFDLPRRAYVGDYFGVRDGEAFAASGWRNFASFFGASNISDLPDKGTWISTLSTNACLWAYGCGAGSFTSIGGLGNSDSYNDGTTTELVQNNIQAAFLLLFGSWLGDWDSEDDILRSVLALPGYGLTAAWSGRPHWFLHHMALGETIGYGARLTQNNGLAGLYQTQVNSCAGQIHIALMGDPTLRMHVVAPPANLRVEDEKAGVHLSWTPSSEAVAGYHVFAASAMNGSFKRLTTVPLTALEYYDNSGTKAFDYMVRAVKLETSASGSYFNLSQGAFLNGGQDATLLSSSKNVPAISTFTNAIATTPETVAPGAIISWVDDGLPAGAVSGTSGGDSWNWVSSNPKPASGNLANQSNSATGLHQHFFTYATNALTVSTGEVLVAYVHLDPRDVPSELMLQWNDGSWEHRAYWGANRIEYGAPNTASRRYMGPLPPAGQWIRLVVPAQQVALEGSSIGGMAFTLFDGRATWDNAGKATLPHANTALPPVKDLAITPTSADSN
jgi:hypothetical protein